MKKRALVLMMVGAMTMANLTACGSKESAAPTTATETTVAETTTAEETTTVAEETTEAETTEAAESEADAVDGEDFNAQYDTYLAWTATEWADADEESKLNAAIAYSIYATEAVSGQTFDDAMRAMTAEEMKKTEDVKAVITQLDTMFPSMNMSLKEFADMGVEQIKSMTETTVAQ